MFHNDNPHFIFYKYPSLNILIQLISKGGLSIMISLVVCPTFASLRSCIFCGAQMDQHSSESRSLEVEDGHGMVEKGL
jgi:hypothetical protein